MASQNESLPQLASIFKFDEDYIGGCYEKKVVNFMYEESYDEAELSDSDFWIWKAIHTCINQQCCENVSEDVIVIYFLVRYISIALSYLVLM